MSHCPIIENVDLVVVGASSAAVAAALAARRAGASVCVVSPLHYMGEDITSYVRFELAADEQADTELSRQIFSAKKRPAAIKRILEQSLVAADIQIIFASSPVAVLENDDQQICGVVIANRCGRQAIAAKRIIDATEHGLCARVAGVCMHAWNGGAISAEFRVVASEALHQGAQQMQDLFPVPPTSESTSTSVSIDKEGSDIATPIFCYVRTETLADNSMQSWLAAQKRIQADYWQHNSLIYSERALMIAGDAIIARTHVASWENAQVFNLDAMRSADDALSILGPCADVNRDIAGKLYRPAHGMILGERLGTVLAEECKNILPCITVRVRSYGEACTGNADIRMYNNGFEPQEHSYQQIEISEESAPRLGHWDTLVVGGGTGGASAAIASARQNTRTLVIEAQHALGGVGTIGMIAIYYFGNICGFTSEIDEGVAVMGPDGEYKNNLKRWVPQWKQAWYHQQLLQDHVDLCYQAVAYGVWREEATVRGVFITTPYGSGMVEAHSIIDATGAADIAAAAGAPCRTINNEHVAVQGAGLSPIYIGLHYSNTDHNFIDDNNQRDVTAAMISAKEKFPEAFDISQIVNSRERRQIYGDYELSPIDFFRDHTFNDSICFASSNFDSHGYTVHPVFTMKAPDKERMWVHVPYRALLPQGIDNVLVTGLGVSAQRDVLPVIRMQGDVQNQGYAAGYAASLVLKEKCNLRNVPMKKLQQHLVDIGNLDAEVLKHQDVVMPDRAEIQAAVKEGSATYKSLAIIFACPEQALPMVRQAYAGCENNNEARRLDYAKIAGLLGDDIGAETLYAHIKNESWDTGWNYRGMGQYGMSTSPYDSAWLAIGRSQAVGNHHILAARISELVVDDYFSHARAIAIACEGIGGSDDNKVLARAIHKLLSDPQVSGYHQSHIHDVQAALTDNSNETVVRNNSLRELVLARALWYCGDHLGLGEKVLQNYAGDMRGIFARHAVAVLTCARQVPAPV